MLSAQNVKQAVRQVLATWTHEKFQTQKVKKNFENDEVMKYLKVPVLYQHTKSIIEAELCVMMAEAKKISLERSSTSGRGKAPKKSRGKEKKTK